jgi:hypothetical protein
MNLVVKALRLQLNKGGTRVGLIGVSEKRKIWEHGVHGVLTGKLRRVSIWIVLSHAWSHKVISHKRDNRNEELSIHFSALILATIFPDGVEYAAVFKLIERHSHNS